MVISNELCSKDGTKKYSLTTEDGRMIEACTLKLERPTSDTMICVSSQIGCQYKCKFCISGNKNFVRNLLANEIIEQVSTIMAADESIGPRLEITYMGTGEPLANVNNVLASAEYLLNKNTIITKINLSTVLPRIDVPFELFSILKRRGHIQYSLHFTNDELRRRYMSHFPSILDSIDYLNGLSKYIDDRPCINYLLFDGINDSLKDAKRLVEIAIKCNAYLKISKYSPINLCALTPSRNFENFIDTIKESNIDCKSFKSKGEDIHAACGHFLWDVTM